jgi:hypothetical protein
MSSAAAGVSAGARVARRAAVAQHFGAQQVHANRTRNNVLLAVGLVGFVYGVYAWTRHRVKDMDVFADKADELDEVRLVKSELAAKGIKMNSDAPPLK